MAALRNPQKSAAALRPRRAPGDARRVAGPPARRAIVSVSTLLVNVARDVGPRPSCRACGGLGLRERAADGPDEPPALRCRDDLHPHELEALVRRLEAACARWPASAATSRPSCPRRWRSAWSSKFGSAGALTVTDTSRCARSSGHEEREGEAEWLIQRAVDVVNSAKAMPLSASVLVPGTSCSTCWSRRWSSLPDELRQAALAAARARAVHGRAGPRGRRADGGGPGAGRADGVAHRDRPPGQPGGPADPRRRQRGGAGACATRPRTTATRSWPAWRSCSSGSCGPSSPGRASWPPPLVASAATGGRRRRRGRRGGRLLRPGPRRARSPDGDGIPSSSTWPGCGDARARSPRGAPGRSTPAARSTRRASTPAEAWCRPGPRPMRRDARPLRGRDRRSTGRSARLGGRLPALCGARVGGSCASPSTSARRRPAGRPVDEEIYPIVDDEHRPGAHGA